MDKKESVRQFYTATADTRAGRLAEKRFNLHRDIYLTHLALFEELMQGVPNCGQGLDVGSGPGVWAEFLANYCDGVLGVDFVEENIALAAASAERRGLTGKIAYQVGDAEELEGIRKSSFDIATHISVLQHLPDKRRALENVYEVLKPGGRLLLLAQNRRCLYNWHQRSACADAVTIGINDYSELKELRATLESVGFEIEAVRPCWLFVRDLLYIGAEHRLLRFANPLRRPLMVMFESVEKGLNRFPSLNPLFREIVFLARK